MLILGLVVSERFCTQIMNTQTIVFLVSIVGRWSDPIATRMNQSSGVNQVCGFLRLNWNCHGITLHTSDTTYASRSSNMPSKPAHDHSNLSLIINLFEQIRSLIEEESLKDVNISFG